MVGRFNEHVEEAENCPPKDAVGVNLDAYRLVVKSSFELDPSSQFRLPREVDKSTIERCECKSSALSMFNTSENLVKHYQYLKRFLREIDKRIGSCIVMGRITPDDGVCLPADKRGHFSFFSYEPSTDYLSRFEIIGDCNDG